MKRLIVCCDGTWNSLQMAYPTNVVKISQACKDVAADGTPQVLFYNEGIGTEGGLNTFLGGAFGWGIDKDIQDAYRFLCLNYHTDEHGGDEVYLFGFSRGAYTVRSLAGMIYCSGLLPRHEVQRTSEAYDLYRDRQIAPGDPNAIAFRAQYGSKQIPITLIGCWDTVGALGIPQLISGLPINDIANKKYQFHDVKLNRQIQHALHAIAIDERRRPFNVNHMELSEGASTNIREAWFPGTHGCVGGGTKDLRGLSDVALKWMVEQIPALGLGLEFDETWLSENTYLDHKIEFSDSPGIYVLAGVINRAITGSLDGLHESVEQRFRDVSHYRPDNVVKAFGAEVQTWIA